MSHGTLNKVVDAFLESIEPSADFGPYLAANAGGGMAGYLVEIVLRHAPATTLAPPAAPRRVKCLVRDHPYRQREWRR